MNLKFGNFEINFAPTLARHNRKVLKIQFDHEYRMAKLEHSPKPGIVYNQCTWGTPMIVSAPEEASEKKYPSSDRASEYLVNTLGLEPELANRVIETLSQFYNDKKRR